MEHAIGWDLDSTLCDTRHRWDLSPRINPDSTWEKYSLACIKDDVIEGAAALMRIMRRLDPTLLHIAISGRSACALPQTIHWAGQHALPLDKIMLRADGDHTPNGRYKVNTIRDLQKQGIIFDLYVEDWGEAAAYIHEKTGIPVLGVTPFYPEDMPTPGS